MIPTLSAIFTAANVFVLPFWALMILVPQWSWSKRILSSYLPFVALALVYLALFVGGITPDNAAALASPKLTDVAAAFAEPAIAAIGWVHFLVLDLFVGRWIYWEGQRTGVWTRHSLVLTLFAGPLGLLSHIVTAAIAEGRGLLPKPSPEAAPES